jgi:TrpR-related protein YerC/YecD
MKMRYESRLASEEADRLFAGVLALETVEDCYRFFDDLCTIKEVQAMAQRFTVAGQLKAGVTYQEIAQTTGASTATISRVNRCLHYGAGGYQLVLERLRRDK